MSDISLNKQFHKLIHDSRNGTCKVYGLTDDMIICVDEIKKRSFTWHVQDKEANSECKEIYELLGRWPKANESKCKYGVFKDVVKDTLRSRCYSI